MEKEYCNQTVKDITRIREKMICVPQFNKSRIDSISEARRAVADNKCSGAYQISKACEIF